jgi:hypothetical protein
MNLDNLTHEITITSLAAPPARYADRVIAEMMQGLAVEAAHVRGTVRGIVDATADDGGPRGQERLRKRIEAAGTTLGRSNVRTALEPGKRGKYAIRCYCQGSIVRFGNWRRQIFLDSGILFRFKDS